jgi:hypothetical protein
MASAYRTTQFYETLQCPFFQYTTNNESARKMSDELIAHQVVLSAPSKDRSMKSMVRLIADQAYHAFIKAICIPNPDLTSSIGVQQCTKSPMV